MLEKLRQEEIHRNRAISNKVKADRNKKMEAVLKSRMRREQLADYYRS